MECPNSDSFCYICGLFTPPKFERNITKKLVECFEEYFLLAYRPYLWYAPGIICDYCQRNLYGWKKRTHRLKYVQPIVWLPRTEHSREACYFCVNKSNAVGYRYETRDQMTHAVFDSIIPARLRTTKQPFAPSELPEEVDEYPPDFDNFNQVDLNQPSTSHSGHASTSAETEASKTCSSGYEPSIHTAHTHGVQHLVTISDYLDLIRDTSLSTRTAEILASRLQQWNLVAPDFRVTFARTRDSTVCNKSAFDECFRVHEETKIA